jgi:hypothetical protein
MRTAARELCSSAKSYSIDLSELNSIRSRVDEPKRDSLRFLETNDLTAGYRAAAHLLISWVKFSGS